MRRTVTLLSRQERDFFKSVYRRSHGPIFSVIKVGGEVVDRELDTLAKTCTELHRMNLKPIVIHGGGPQMNDELEARGVEPRYVRGHRVTDAATLEIAHRVFSGLNEKVVDALNAVPGVKAKGFSTGIFNAVMNQPELEYVGEIVGINKEPLRECFRDDVIPVLTSLGSTTEGQLLNINADVAAREMALWIKPMRTFFTSAKGGWIDDETRELVGTIDLSRDYEKLANRDYTGRQGTLLKLNEIKSLLENLPQSASVSITSAEDVLTELFTHRGAGTLFLNGEKFDHLDSLDRLSRHTQKLLFGGDYISSLEQRSAKVAMVVVNQNRTAGAVLLAPQGQDASDRSSPLVVDRVQVDPAQYTNQLSGLWGAIQSELPNGVVFPRAEGAQDQPATPRYGGKDPFEQAAMSLGTEAARQVGFLGDPGTALPPTKAADILATVSGGDALSRPLGRPERVKVGLLGARGYVGGLFVKLLTGHPDLELVLASSRQLEGQNVSQGFGLNPDEAAKQGIAQDLNFVNLGPEDVPVSPVAQEVDAWVLALPNGLAPPFVEPLAAVGAAANDGTGALLIDLGADFRFTNEWTYGIPERPGARALLRGSRRIANPGCYATGTQIGLMPLVQFGGDTVSAKASVHCPPSVFGVSGYSGAGTTPSDKNDPAVLEDNLLAYSLVNHIHERECSRHLGTRIGFMPHVGSFFQGISLTLSVQLDPLTTGGFPTAEDVYEHFATFYDQERLIKVSRSAPQVKRIVHSHEVHVGGFTVDPVNGRLAYVVAIDNLLKGAASQALQNINIALDLDEYCGIEEPMIS